MTLRLAKLQNAALHRLSVYSRVIQRVQAWLGEPPILTMVCKDKE